MIIAQLLMIIISILIGTLLLFILAQFIIAYYKGRKKWKKDASIFISMKQISKQFNQLDIRQRYSDKRKCSN